MAARAEPVKIGEIEEAVNARRSRIEAMLKVLEVEGAVERADGGWRRTLQPWTYDAERVESVTAQRAWSSRLLDAPEGARRLFAALHRLIAGAR